MRDFGDYLPEDPIVPDSERKGCSALTAQVGGKHYKALAIQPAEYCQRNRMPYCESSVVRYVTRHREKNGREDIEKAIHCLQLLLEIEYPQNDQADPLHGRGETQPEK
jgi:hypothetical protein